MSASEKGYIPVKTGGKLFGLEAERVTTDEMHRVYRELYILINDFDKMVLSRYLPSKETHGDIDIIVLSKMDESSDLQRLLRVVFPSQIIKYSRNGNCHSVLFYSNAIQKKVHVDFIYLTDESKFSCHVDYYSFNDFSGIIGIFSKKMHFKYGTEGFFKRYRDKKGNWHDIHITDNLMTGLEILGYVNAEKYFNKIENLDDIIKFVIYSPMFDVSFFTHEEMNQSDRKSMKRAVLSHVVQQIRKTDKKATITDEDFFLKLNYYQLYEKVENEKRLIEEKVFAINNPYNGTWLIEKFNMRPGKEMGMILKSICEKFGTEPVDVPEADVIDFVRNNSVKINSFA